MKNNTSNKKIPMLFKGNNVDLLLPKHRIIGVTHRKDHNICLKQETFGFTNYRKKKVVGCNILRIYKYSRNVRAVVLHGQASQELYQESHQKPVSLSRPRHHIFMHFCFFMLDYFICLPLFQGSFPTSAPLHNNNSSYIIVRHVPKVNCLRQVCFPILNS